MVGYCKNPNTFLLQVWWGAGWQKSGLNLKKKPKSVVFAPLDTHQKVSTLFVIIAKVKSSQTFFYVESLFPTCLV